MDTKNIHEPYITTDGVDVCKYMRDAVDTLRHAIIWDTNNPMVGKGEIDMERNRVLDLYVDRKRELIKDEYFKRMEDSKNNNPIVKEYTELINTFEASLAETATRYNRENAEYDFNIFVQKNLYGTVEWCINNMLYEKIKLPIYEERNKKLDELDDLANEVQVLLTLSDDKDYQIEVLKNYGILDKKTGKLTI